MRSLVGVFFGAIAFALLIGASTKPAAAALHFCNHSGQGVDIAVNENSADSYMGMLETDKSEGWWSAQPGECLVPNSFSGNLDTNSAYSYYAETWLRDGPLVTWTGGGSSGTMHCTVRGRAFTFYDDKGSDCVLRSFRAIPIGSYTDYTVTLTK